MHYSAIQLPENSNRRKIQLQKLHLNKKRAIKRKICQAFDRKFKKGIHDRKGKNQFKEF